MNDSKYLIIEKKYLNRIFAALFFFRNFNNSSMHYNDTYII